MKILIGYTDLSLKEEEKGSRVGGHKEAIQIIFGERSSAFTYTFGDQ